MFYVSYRVNLQYGPAYICSLINTGFSSGTLPESFCVYLEENGLSQGGRYAHSG